MFGGDISNFVPACIVEDVKKRICEDKNGRPSAE